MMTAMFMLFATLAKYCTMEKAAVESRPVVGSSRKSTLGLEMRPTPMETRLISPPDRLATRVCWRSVRPNTSSISSVRSSTSFSSSQVRRPTSTKCSRIVITSFTSSNCGTYVKSLGVMTRSTKHTAPSRSA
mmetsp:Transcript_11269/g.18343  ORF Transcript_11269/g.18343 Transcript_11269/m.18343 type:complete len:132 (+) Transcript_11269:1650-2045(+)